MLGHSTGFTYPDEDGDSGDTQRDYPRIPDKPQEPTEAQEGSEVLPIEDDVEQPPEGDVDAEG